MFKWKSDAERKSYGPHKWIERNLGHSQHICKFCCGTPNEIAVIGDMNHCEKRPPTRKAKP